MEGSNRRGASGGKLFNDRTKNRCSRDGHRRDPRQRPGHGDIHGGGIHLAMGKESDGALMAVFAGVRVKPFVQRGRHHHGVQQQHQRNQQQGENRLAGP